MRTAISPRLAMRILWIVMDGLQTSNVDLGDRLTGHHGLFILDKETHDPADRACLHLVERLHDLDEADRIVLRDGIAIGFVVRLVRRRLAIEYAWPGGNDLLYGEQFLLL